MFDVISAPGARRQRIFSKQEFLKPTKKLVIKVEQKDANGSSSTGSTSFVAEKDGKLVIPVPGPCK